MFICIFVFLLFAQGASETLCTQCKCDFDQRLVVCDKEPELADNFFNDFFDRIELLNFCDLSMRVHFSDSAKVVCEFEDDFGKLDIF